VEIVVAFVGFLLDFLVVGRPWVWGVFECSPELVALLSGVVALQMPQTLLF
jgi:predicted Co/Zn/Cd cation transporter (cation efflux family)